VMIPMVHLLPQTTPRKVLLRQVEDATRALLNAVNMLHETAPRNGDYYHWAYVQAQREHKERLGKLQVVYSELLVMYEKIEGAGR